VMVQKPMAKPNIVAAIAKLMCFRMAVSLLPPTGWERTYVASEPIGVMAITCCAFPALFLSRGGEHDENWIGRLLGEY
jgi:hypothetical protein